jgi:hypothetical protein
MMDYENWRSLLAILIEELWKMLKLYLRVKIVLANPSTRRMLEDSSRYIDKTAQELSNQVWSD